MNIEPTITALFSGLILAPTFTLACTAFRLQSNKDYYAIKRFDYYTDLGLITTHVRGQQKSSLRHDKFVGQPVNWMLRYGSVTFGLMASEFPVGGLNEAGLSVESLFDFDSVFPAEAGTLPYINNRQWLQFLLDQAATVDQAIALTQRVRVHALTKPNHLFICDAGGACAVLEFANGNLVATAHDQLQPALITNYSFKSSVAGTPDKAGDTRFTRAAAAIRGYTGKKSIFDFGYDLLERVPLGPEYTGWQVIYNLTKKQVFFHSQEAPGKKQISLAKIDFSPRAQQLMLDIHDQREGDVSRKLKPYDKRIDSGFTRNFMGGYGRAIEEKYAGLTDSIIGYSSRQAPVAHELTP